MVKLFISTQKVVRPGNTVVLDEKNPHIRNIRDGTVIKLDVISVHKGHVGSFRCNRSSFQLAGTVSGHTAFDKLVGLVAMCRGGEAEISQIEEMEDAELNGIEEGEVRMREAAGNEVGCDRTSKETDAEWESLATKNTGAVLRLVHALYDGQKTHPSPRQQTNE